ncbi:MAG: hypothetical protein QRY74_06055 [Chlamydia sp.]
MTAHDEEIIAIEESIQACHSDLFELLKTASQKISNSIVKGQGEGERGNPVQEAIAFIGEEKYFQILQKTIYGNLLLIFQKFSSFLDANTSQFFKSYKFCEVLEKLQKNMSNWSDSISVKRSSSIKKKENEVKYGELFIEALIHFLFPLKKESLYIALPKIVELSFGSYIRTYLFDSLCKYLLRNSELLFSSLFRKKILLKLYSSNPNYYSFRFQASTVAERDDENSIDEIMAIIKSILDSILPEPWRKKLPFFPIRQGVTQCYSTCKNRYMSKTERDRDMLSLLILLIDNEEQFLERPAFNASDDEIVDLAETWIERKSTLEALVSPFIWFSQEKLAERLRSDQIVQESVAPEMLAVAFSHEIKKKMVESMAFTLNWDENSPKFIRKITRYFLSNHFSLFLKNIVTN